MPEAHPIYLRNTMGGRELEEFRPIEPGRVLLYSCGPTVYSYSHIGNFRAYVFADTLRRMLEYNGYEIRQARNITDVGHLTNDELDTGLDKMEVAAQREHRTPQDIAAFYTKAFLEDAARLNIKEPEFAPRATEYIGPMIELVERLIEGGHGYVSGGNVYYDVSTFPAYGRLSGNTVADLIAGARVEPEEGKRSPADFALWKAAGPEKLMRYESPWGMGVPGWHLECSAMALCLLGNHIDMHTGGIDHIFPHHEDEIAQSEGATGEKFVNFWLHNAFLQLAGDEKMAKSAGNIYTVGDLVERGFHPLALRYFTFQAHYRSALNFTWDALEAAQTALIRLWEATAELIQTEEEREVDAETEQFQRRFLEAVNRDLDLPATIAIVHEAMGSRLRAGPKLALLDDFDRVLALDFLAMGRKISETTPEQEELLEERAKARSERDFPKSDELRKQLATLGLEVKDTPSGQRWARKDIFQV